MAMPPIEAEHPAGDHGFEEEPPQDSEVSQVQVHGRSPSRIAFDRLRSDKIAVISAAVVLFFVLIAIFAPLITSLFGVEHRNARPMEVLDMYGMPGIGPPYNGFTWDAPLGVAPGTGYDLLAEWLYGARTSLLVAALATILTTVIGVVVGLVAGFARGWLDRVVNFIIDMFLAFPFLLGALALAPIISSRFADQPENLSKAQFGAILFVLVFFGWMVLARLVRGEILSLREREFVQAAQVIGVPTRQILFRELLPNLTAPIIVSISLGLPAFVSAEAGLAYLGIGLSGMSSWGQTVNLATDYFDAYPLFLWAPVIGIMLLVLALNLLGDAIRDAFDPKTRR